MHYTRQEVADLLGISKVTVYHYAKQNKIRKVPNPHRTMREALYYREEVDALVEKREEQKVEGYSTAALSKKLGITQKKIYQLIKEHNLPVDEVPHGDEQIRYVFPEETFTWIKDYLKRTAPTRGARSEFHDSILDVAIYQRFNTPDKLETRIIRNEEGEWGFYSSSRSFIPYAKATQELDYHASYTIHCPNVKVTGYTDFVLPKDKELSFLFLDFMYNCRGIENIRLREHQDHLALSVKSGAVEVTSAFPSILTESVVRSFLEGGAGEVVFEEAKLLFVSGYRKTSVELPVTMLDALDELSSQEGVYVQELLEQAIKEFLQSKKEESK